MIGKSFTMQLEHEVISTAKMLARLPADKFDWKPHDKSMTLGRLANHMVDLTGFISKIMDRDELDFAIEPKNKELKTAEELSETLKVNIDQALAKLNAKGEDRDFMMAPWTLRNGDQVIATIPRAGALRGFAISHLIHHRGQLSVYLRMLDIPVPSIYGPSADEMN